MRRAALAVLLAAAAVSSSCAGPRASTQPSPLLGRTVAFTASRLDGREVPVPVPRAAVTVVDFWATWCEPCRDQLPILDRLPAAFPDDRVAVVGISFDEDRVALEEFLARIPVGFAVLWDKGGAALAVKMEITRLPTTLVLDRDGVVRGAHVGFDDQVAAALERDVRRVIAEQQQRDQAAGPAAGR
jgi:thiol-disulfide isomerase/thioredoxin